MLYLETGSGLTLDDTIRTTGGTKIHVNSNSNPEICDWDEDGRKDLIIGEQSYVSPNTGNIRLYINTGTNASPQFDTYTVVQANGNDIYLYRANPRVFDLDQDGLKDLIVGADNGMLHYFKNIGTNANPLFGSYEYLRREDNTIIDAYYGSRFCFTDWYGDGDIDILISGYYGYIEYYENATIGINEHENSIPIEHFSVAPVPAKDKVTFSYSVQKTAEVRVDIYSSEGRFVATPVNGSDNAGEQSITWTLQDSRGNKLAAGVYFARISTGNHVMSARILVLN
jgi:hypothetical protein